MENYKARKENRHKKQEAEKRRMPKHGIGVRKIINIQIKREKKRIKTSEKVEE